jgi:SH3-like domain-containing protein
MPRLALTVLCTLLTQPACAQQAAQPAPVAGTIARPASSAHAPAAAAPAPAVKPVSLPLPKIVTFERTAGPFQVRGQTFTFVEHVQSIDRRPHDPDSDETVEWWELRDAAGNAVYHQQLAVELRDGSFDESNDVSARLLKTRLGEGILVDGGFEPSAPDYSGWFQVFGLFNGKLVPFGPPMSTQGEFLGEAEDTYQPSAMVRGQQPTTVTRDVLNFRVWTGNFSIIYPVLIDWMQAKVRPAWTCYRQTAKGMVATCTYRVQADPVRTTKDLTFVRLYAEPEEGFPVKHVVVKPDSKIEYLEGQMAVDWKATKDGISIGMSDGADVWLHVRIDGQDGWIHTQEDFDAVGLPQAG